MPLACRQTCRSLRTSELASKPTSVRQVHHSPCYRNARPSFRVYSKIGDELLDFVTAGPKLRKWYGQGERLPRDGGGGDEDPEEEQQQQQEEEAKAIVRDAVLVTDAESATGEQVLLQLILARARVKACVRNTGAAKTSFGAYVEPLSFDPSSAGAWQAALRDVSAVVCVGSPAALPAAAAKSGVEHVVLLSSAGVGQQGGFDLEAMMASGEDKLLKDPKREAVLRAAGVPLTIVRAARIKDAPGGTSDIALKQGGPVAGAASGGAVSREDLARVMVQALQRRPTGLLEFQVVSEGSGAAPSNWDQIFTPLQEQPST